MSYTINDDEVEQSIAAVAKVRNEPKIAIIRRLVSAELKEIQATLAHAAAQDRLKRPAGRT